MISRKGRELPLGITPEDLPAWMRQTRREIDWALIVVVLLCAIVVWPLVVRSGIPYTQGMQIQVNRTIEMAESIQSGTLYPRWAADFNYGYGSPLWNYLAPLPHYLTGLHYLLSQANPEISVKTVMIFSYALLGVSLFSFARRQWGNLAGVIAATVYLFSPQILSVLPYLQGDLPGLLALGFFFLSLELFSRLLQGGKEWNVIGAAVSIAALCLSSTPLNLVLVLIMAGWLLWNYAFISLGRSHFRRISRALMLGTSLAAFYWLPVLLESRYVKWESMTHYPMQNWHRLSPGQMLAFPQRLDLAAINPEQSLALGPAIWLLALLTVGLLFVGGWRRTPLTPGVRSRGEAYQQKLVTLIRAMPDPLKQSAYFGLVSLFLFLFVTPLFSPVWDALPEWPPLYPSDLIPVMAACGALVVAQLGYLIQKMESNLKASLVAFVVLAGIAGAALPTLYPADWPWSAWHRMPSVLTLLDDEVRGYIVASQTTGWLMPETVKNPPSPSPTLHNSYRTEVIDKVARDQIPPATQVDTIIHKPNIDRLAVQTPNETEIVLLTFYFPGWQAQVDGQRVPVRASSDGLITFRVPSGHHEVVVRFGSTVMRTLSWIVSGMSAGILLVVGMRQRTRKQPETYPLYRATPVSEKLLLLCSAFLFIAVAVVVRLNPRLVTVQSPPGMVKTAQQALPRIVQGEIDLLAFDVSKQEVKPGDEIKITLYWRAVRPDLPDLQVDVAVMDEAQQQVSFAQHRHPGMIPSSQWSSWALFDFYVRDTYYLRVDQNAMAGEYNIVVQVGLCQSTLLPCETIDPLFIRDERGSSMGQHIILPVQIRIRP
ncbi:MAG TPA: 6-pyruvoyl-tetrahydropterin synthase-related protein [Aggregatilineaceae bacterium]|nr:6-pyruvoyl-tetrahydropterin synthase-related protein [Aggregatilineaceae bacterium]